jgi:nicotinamide riboside kinase
MRVYFVGGHAVGKSLLSRYVSEKYNLRMIHETARTVLSEFEIPFTVLRADIEKVNDYQIRVFDKQVQVENEYKDNFVSDRAFDNIAYAAEHSMISSEVFNGEAFKRYMDWIKDGIIFFIRPHKELMSNDGCREQGSWEDIVSIDAMIKFILETSNIQYVPLHDLSLQQRIRLIDYILVPQIQNLKQIEKLNKRSKTK